MLPSSRTFFCITMKSANAMWKPAWPRARRSTGFKRSCERFRLRDCLQSGAFIALAEPFEEGAQSRCEAHANPRNRECGNLGRSHTKQRREEVKQDENTCPLRDFV